MLAEVYLVVTLTAGALRASDSGIRLEEARPYTPFPPYANEPYHGDPYVYKDGQLRIDPHTLNEPGIKQLSNQAHKTPEQEGIPIFSQNPQYPNNYPPKIETRHPVYRPQYPSQPQTRHPSQYPRPPHYRPTQTQYPQQHGVPQSTNQYSGHSQSYQQPSSHSSPQTSQSPSPLPVFIHSPLPLQQTIEYSNTHRGPLQVESPEGEVDSDNLGDRKLLVRRTADDKVLISWADDDDERKRRSTEPDLQLLPIDKKELFRGYTPLYDADGTVAHTLDARGVYYRNNVNGDVIKIAIGDMYKQHNLVAEGRAAESPFYSHEVQETSRGYDYLYNIITEGNPIFGFITYLLAIEAKNYFADAQDFHVTEFLAFLVEKINEIYRASYGYGGRNLDTDFLDSLELYVKKVTTILESIENEN